MMIFSLERELVTFFFLPEVLLFPGAADHFAVLLGKRCPNPLLPPMAELAAASIQELKRELET